MQSKANKIVAGLEPEKTNAWLQRLHAAATTCAGEKSDAAVARVQSGELIGASKELIGATVQSHSFGKFL